MLTMWETGPEGFSSKTRDDRGQGRMLGRTGRLAPRGEDARIPTVYHRWTERSYLWRGSHG
jgi:hypothetical protein